MNFPDILILVASYVLGSIPFSYVITRLKTGKDIRTLGSQNVGATNVIRTAGKIPGLLALVLDAAKGIAAVLIAKKFGVSSLLPGLAGCAAMIGHSYPVFLKFRGGKSVATGAGAFGLLAPLPLVSSLGIFFLSLFAFRTVSIGSIIASAFFPLFVWLWKLKALYISSALAAAIIIYRHKRNILGLYHGRSRKENGS